MRVACWGPSGLDGAHIHKPGCQDTKRGRYLSTWVEEPWELEVSSLKEIVEAFYGPEAGSFYGENGFAADDPEAWRYFAAEFQIFPCVGKLPEVARD